KPFRLRGRIDSSILPFAGQVHDRTRRGARHQEEGDGAGLKLTEITCGTTIFFADPSYPDAPERQTKTRLLSISETRKGNAPDIYSILN
ncbi:MAG: hypothetical protein AAB325_01815, partial [Pseudomonadota bacterium]